VVFASPPPSATNGAALLSDTLLVISNNARKALVSFTVLAYVSNLTSGNKLLLYHFAHDPLRIFVLLAAFPHE
jgi:hypothetical protein